MLNNQPVLATGVPDRHLCCRLNPAAYCTSKKSACFLGKRTGGRGVKGRLSVVQGFFLAALSMQNAREEDKQAMNSSFIPQIECPDRGL